jgi:hypothetical protein
LLALGHDESPEAAITGTARIFEETLAGRKALSAGWR